MSSCTALVLHCYPHPSGVSGLRGVLSNSSVTNNVVWANAVSKTVNSVSRSKPRLVTASEQLILNPETPHAAVPSFDNDLNFPLNPRRLKRVRWAKQRLEKNLHGELWMR